MRDPDRIDKYLDDLKRVWKKYPDVRLMQLLMNVTGDGPNVYYLEDNTVIEAVTKYYEEVLK